jgi:hypothetical protein
MVCDDKYMYDVKLVDDEVIVGDGRPLSVKKIGKLRLNFKSEKEIASTVVLEDVKFVPSLKMNLFSLALGLKKGWKLESKGTTLTLSKYEKIVKFDRKIPMGTSFL